MKWKRFWMWFVPSAAIVVGLLIGSFSLIILASILLFISIISYFVMGRNK
ncbi:hypothetical protein [Pseudalkalibacillus caeni]|nr:hypothetical protein [Pseudalkalibacillus caeni]